MGMVTLIGFIALLLCLPPYNVHAELQRLTTNEQFNPEKNKLARKSPKESSLQQ